MRIIPLLLICSCIAAPISWAGDPPIKEMFEQASKDYDAGKYEEAINLYKKIIQVAPSFAPAYNGLGLSVKGLDGDTEEAVGYLKTAIAQDPKFVQSYENIGRLYYMDQDFDKAQEYLEQALKIDPNSLSAKLNLGWIYLMARGKPQKALSYFKQVNAVNPSPMTYYGLGLAYFADNQRDKALDIITTLRNMGQEDYASRLEKAVRETRHVNPEPMEIQKTNDKTTSTQTSTAQPSAPINPGQSGSGAVKVRLRGKLSDI